MKKRLITAVIGLSLMAVILIWRDTVVLNIAISLLSIIATIEIFSAVKAIKNTPMLMVSSAFAAIVPFLSRSYLPVRYDTICFVYVVIMLCIMLKKHSEINLEQIGFIFMAVIFLPFALSSMIVLIDEKFGLFYFILAMLCAWMTDAGAYFVGRICGKHKLAPKLSPHKTVEGAIGGVIINVIFCLVFAGIYSTRYQPGIEVSFLLLGLVAVLGSLASMVGDLSASCLKRAYHIKDFGDIMPGHGGVIDRFDSVLIVAPLIMVLTRYLTLLQ